MVATPQAEPVRIDARLLAKAVEDAIPRLACDLPPDMTAALQLARADEHEPLAFAALQQLCENACIAHDDGVPICQDTGTVQVCLELGADACAAGDVFGMVDEAVSRAYREHALRASVVRDAVFDRANTADNTPAFCEIRTGGASVSRLHVMLKGGGSDNASRVSMLPPGAGRDGIVSELVQCVHEKAANACPPLVVGIGIGSTFDKVAGLAKSALMRPVGTVAATEDLRALEAELLAAANGTRIGAGGMGGSNTVLAVHVKTAPCHIAALPVAINLGCSAMRRISFRLQDGNWVEEPAHGFADPSSRCVGDEGARAPAPAAAAAAEASGSIRIQLPEQRDMLRNLTAGQACSISGTLFTLRDAGHQRLLGELGETGELPYGLAGQTIFYAGPTPSAAGRPFGAIGPTTASRMDFAAPRLHRAGIAATIGKGKRSAELAEACRENGSVYFAAIGGSAALLAKCVESSETVAYADLGTEALRRISVRDFPVVVAIDAKGEGIYG